LFLYDNMLTGNNYTFPDCIEHCWTLCDSLTNNFTNACRSLWLFHQGGTTIGCILIWIHA
jgi:hypothetical protein